MDPGFEQLLKDFQKKQFVPVYFFHGLEPYFIDELMEALDASVLEESEKAFNLSVLYGKEIDHLAVVDAAMRFPMMAERQLVLIKEAQEMKQLKDLEGYVKNPTQTTVLAIAYKGKKYNFNSNFGKLLKSKAVVFESKPLYDNQIVPWITQYLKRLKFEMAPEAAALLAEYLGTDIAKIRNELDKLSLNIPAGSKITADIIEKYIGISKDYNVFELQRALGQRQHTRAQQIVNYFAANARKHPMPVIIGTLAAFFSKLYLLKSLAGAPEKEVLDQLKLKSSYFLKDYQLAARNFSLVQLELLIAMLAEYDLKSKGVFFNNTGKEEGALLRELVWRITHVE
ncbi:MAG: DNA polymerase III subunit delta [Saprospiraceae bacterium]|nr:DNA polymerase III subunit delta [Saprospiraceae bacterium]MDP4999998.1 DNA polymerase III subunit delta [Saprospiraceae bacterium]